MRYLKNSDYPVHCRDANQVVVELPEIYQTREQLLGVPVDSSIAPNVRRLLKAGWYTISSCSGLKADHPSGVCTNPSGDTVPVGSYVVFIGNKHTFYLLRDAGFDVVNPQNSFIAVAGHGTDVDRLEWWERVTKFLEDHAEYRPTEEELG